MTDLDDSRTEVPPIHNCGYIHKKNEPCPSHSVGPLKTWNKKQIDAALLSITNLTEQVERLQAENDRLEHNNIHYLQMLEDAGIDSSAAQQSECIYEAECRSLQARIELLEKIIKAADLLADEVRCEERKGLLISDAAVHYFIERQALAAFKEQSCESEIENMPRSGWPLDDTERDD